MTATPPGPPTPPRRTAALLEAVLPPADAPVVLGDLAEAFVRRASEHGVPAARRWYRREALRYALRLGPGRAGSAVTTALGSDMINDLRLAARRILRNPAFSAVVVATLALGIGANATIFTVVDAVLFRSLPVEEPGRLVQVYGSSERDGNIGGMFQGFLPLSYPDFEDVRDAVTTLEGMYVHSQWPVSATVGDEAERIDGLYVSASYFDVLGVRPVVGRTFRPDEDQAPGADAVVVLRHGYWERRFGGDPSVVGRAMVVNARALEIIGVAPPGFRGTSTTLQPDIFVPVSMVGDVPPWGPLWTERGLRFFFAGGRIAPGRTPADVEAELDALAARLGETYPDTNRNRGLQALPLDRAKVDPNQGGMLARTGAVLLVMAGLVLLIACLNVANLLLARSLSRSGEMAVRASLGADRVRLVREMAAESGLLFALGAGLGVTAAVFAASALDGLRPPVFFGGSLDVAVDGRVLGLTVAVTLACALLFGVGPAVRASRQPAGGLRSRRAGATAASRRLRELLVAGQVALSVVALAGAGTFLRSLDASRAIDPGFSVDGLGLLDVDLAAQGLGPEEQRVFYTRMVEEAAALPGVLTAAVGSERPLGPAPLRRATRMDEDRSDGATGRYVRVEAVTADFFATLELPVVEGRALDAGDRDGTTLVAVPNRRLADMMWPGDPALGQRLEISLVDEPLEVVGVAADAKAVSLTEDPQPILYVPMDQHGAPAATLFVRMRTPAALEAARRAVEALDPTLPVFDVTTAQGLVAEDLWTARATATVLGLFGVLGLLLAGVGIYGVVAHSVRERTREMGLRMALGAPRRRVLREVLVRILLVAGAGAAAGTVAAVFTVRAFAGLLQGVTPGDPVTLGSVVAGLLLVAVAAAAVPAHRATRVDPMVVLRSE
ncbi:MAG: ADOP family duplicated permease [Longimicrobiales bacterium]